MARSWDSVRRHLGVPVGGSTSQCILDIRIRFVIHAAILCQRQLSEKKSMGREQILEILIRSKPTLQAQFGVKSMALFGSIVRDEAREDSDVDILVEFTGSATSKQYFGVQFHLEDLLGRPVDLVTEKALRSELRCEGRVRLVILARAGVGSNIRSTNQREDFKSVGMRA